MAYEYDTSRYSSSGQDTAVQSPDELRAQLERLRNGGALSSLRIETDEDGKTRLLGFEISRELKPILETFIPNVTNWLQRYGSKFTYDRAHDLAKAAKFKDARAQAIAFAAEAGIRWGVIAAKPLIEGITLSKNYAHERAELFKELKPVLESTGVNYKTNEVIKNAFDDLHRDMVADTKMLASDLITIAPLIYIGALDQQDANKRRLSRSAATVEISPAGSEDFMETLRQRQKQEAGRRSQIAEARKKFIDDEVAAARLRGEDAPPRADIGEWFDTHVLNKTIDAHDSKSNVESEAHQSKRQSKRDLAMSDMTLAGTAIVASIVKTDIRKHTDKYSKPVNAWKMIKRLKEEVDGGNLSADEIKSHVLDIFQQHERDRTHTTTSQTAEERQKHNLLGPAMVEQLMPAVEMISEAIANRRLDAYALVNLVGDNKIIEHKPSGARIFAKENDVKKILGELTPVLAPRENVNAEEFFANFADPALVQGTLKQNLETMNGLPKAMMVALFPDEILKQTGMKQEEIIANRKLAHQYMEAYVANSVQTMAQQSPEVLKSLGLTDKNIEAIRATSESLATGDRKSLEDVMPAVRTAALNEQISNKVDGQTYWTSRIEAIRSAPLSRDKDLPAAGSAVEREAKRRGSEPSELLGV